MKISQEPFDYVYEEYAKELLQIAYGYTKNKEDSIDIMQNAYVALLESNKKFESNEHVKYFLIRVTINESINFVKSHNKKRVVYDNDIVMMPLTKQNLKCHMIFQKLSPFYRKNTKQ